MTASTGEADLYAANRCFPPPSLDSSLPLSHPLVYGSKRSPATHGRTHPLSIARYQLPGHTHAHIQTCCSCMGIHRCVCVCARACVCGCVCGCACVQHRQLLRLAGMHVTDAAPMTLMGLRSLSLSLSLTLSLSTSLSFNRTPILTLSALCLSTPPPTSS